MNQTAQKNRVYTLIGLEGSVVYIGITKSERLEKRIAEHRKSGKEFQAVRVSEPMSRKMADKQETTEIQKHQKDNFGIPPIYNKAKVRQDWIDQVNNPYSPTKVSPVKKRGKKPAKKSVAKREINNEFNLIFGNELPQKRRNSQLADPFEWGPTENTSRYRKRRTSNADFLMFDGGYDFLGDGGRSSGRRKRNEGDSWDWLM